MTREEKVRELNRMLARCPELMTPNTLIKWTHFGKNRVYTLLKEHAIRSFIIYRGGYVISKDDLIDFLVSTSDDPSSKKYHIKGDDVK